MSFSRACAADGLKVITPVNNNQTLAGGINDFKQCQINATYICIQNYRYMNFFKVKTCWTNAELIPVKLGIAAGYVLLGAYFHNFFRHYYLPVLALFVIMIIWAVYLWLRKMKDPKESLQKS